MPKMLHVLPILASLRQKSVKILKKICIFGFFFVSLCAKVNVCTFTESNTFNYC